MTIPTFGSMTPYSHQWEAITNIKTHIREQLASSKNGGKTKHAVLNASVSSGKSLMMGGIAHHCDQVGARCMILTDVGELASQNGEELFNMGTKCSYFSAYVGQKSTYFTNVVATVGTVVNSLDSHFTPYDDVNPIPHILLIDECFAGETMVQTRNGKFRIDDHSLINQEILCVDEGTMRHFYQKPLRVFPNGVRCTSRVKFKCGEVLCTSTHKIFSSGLWVQAKDLKAGQKVTLSGLQDSVFTKLLRASAAVVRKLFQLQGA